MELGLMFLHQKTTLLISCLWSVLDSHCSVLDSFGLQRSAEFKIWTLIFYGLPTFSSLSHYKGPFQQHWLLFNLSGDWTLTVAVLHQHLPAQVTHINLTSKPPLHFLSPQQYREECMTLWMNKARAAESVCEITDTLNVLQIQWRMYIPNQYSRFTPVILLSFFTVFVINQPEVYLNICTGNVTPFLTSVPRSAVILD